MRILALDLGAGWRGGQTQTALVCRRPRGAGSRGALVVRRHSALAHEMHGDASGDRVVEAPRRAGEASPRLLLRGRRGRPAPASRRRLGLRRARTRRRRLEPRGARSAPRRPPARRLPARARSALAPEVPGRAPLRRHLRGGRPRPLRSAGIPTERIAVVPDGLPLAAFLDAPAPPAPPFRLVHVGAFDGLKGQDVAIAALAPRRRARTRRDAHVPRRRTAARRDRDASPRQPRRPFALHLRRRGPRRPRASRRVAPSSSAVAERGRVRSSLVEAMAAGCPVLVHDLPAPREICGGGAAGASFRRSSPGPGPTRSRASSRDPEERLRLVAEGRTGAASGRSPRASSASKTFSRAASERA